jgi:hypothetical protein
VLQKPGCDEIQGYLVSRPVPADESVALMERRTLFPRTAMVWCDCAKACGAAARGDALADGPSCGICHPSTASISISTNSTVELLPTRLAMPTVPRRRRLRRFCIQAATCIGRRSR